MRAALELIKTSCLLLKFVQTPIADIDSVAHSHTLLDKSIISQKFPFYNTINRLKSSLSSITTRLSVLFLRIATAQPHYNTDNYVSALMALPAFKRHHYSPRNPKIHRSRSSLPFYCPYHKHNRNHLE
jgi:hypothetical protein